MFRFLSRVVAALMALFFLRLLFAAARSASTTPREVGGAGAKRAPGPRAPRIDRGAAQDVPFVELDPSPTPKG